MRLLEISTDALGGVENYSVALPCFDEYQHAVVWHDDLFLFGRNGWVLVVAQGFLDLLLDFEQGGVQRGGLCGNFGEVGNMGGAAVRDTNSNYLRFPTFFTGIFLPCPIHLIFFPFTRKRPPSSDLFQ